jgi:hypothetical protein
MKTNLHHFTNKMYLVTYESCHGLGNTVYGIVRVFNKPQAAQQHLKNLLKEQDKQPSYEKNKIQYDLKTIDLNNPLTTKLFEFNY